MCGSEQLTRAPPSKLWTMEEIGTVTSWASPVYPSYLVLLVKVLDQSLEFLGYIRLNFLLKISWAIFCVCSFVRLVL